MTAGPPDQVIDDPQATPRCYRHPNRLTGTHCTRCGRPVCSECMVEAPVGHHCPTCVQDDNKGVRQINWRPGTTQLGGADGDGIVFSLVPPPAAVCGPIAMTGRRAPVAASARAAEADATSAMSPSGAGGRSSTVR